MKENLYFSTNHRANNVTFKEALIKGLAPDKGLYMPMHIPTFSYEEIASFSKMDYPEIAFSVCNKYLQDQIDPELIKKMAYDAYDYEVPLENVYENKYIMRLDQGPTASFKDFAARMMGRMMQYFLAEDKSRMIILTATSGDTGSAIANAFYGLDNIDVVVLFPENEVTSRQRKQMTTLGKNVSIIAIDGKFDDCQKLVKQAFIDKEMAHLPLSSANSINIGRLIPQIVYYFYAFAKLRKGNFNDDVVFSVPSGNFGDMMGGVIAKHMGLPVKRFVIATNANDEFPRFLATGKYETIVPSYNCISSAMNVGHPSNISRLISLYGGIMKETGEIEKDPDLERMQKDLFSVSIDDGKTRETIRDTYNNWNVLLEPHGAVGWAGLMEYLVANKSNDTSDQLFVSLETAHPAKFPEEILNILNIDPELPKSLEGLEKKEEFLDRIDLDYNAFKEYLLDKFH